jgi:hypothetical protein
MILRLYVATGTSTHFRQVDQINTNQPLGYAEAKQVNNRAPSP